MSVLYTNKKNNYFTNVRVDLISLLPENTSLKILEIGAGAGDTLVRIKELQKAAEVVGVELMEIPNSNQNNPLIDKFIYGNIETTELPLEHETFDVIICGDVLEHLLDPWAVVEKLAKFLKKEGLFLISLPNFSEITTMYKIFVKRDFAYASEGILDKTHFRFFCRKNLSGLFRNNFNVEKIIPSFDRNPAQGTRKIVSRLSLGLFKDYLTSQYLIIARKVG